MNAYNIFRWAIGVVLGLFGCWLIILNFAIVYRWYFRGKHHSWVPLVGGFVAFIGMTICPLPRIQKFAWVPLVVDCGYCVSVLTIGLLTACFETKKKTEDL